MSNRLQLFPHQQATRAKLGMSVIASNRAIMVQAPTAFGKTVLAGSIIAGAMDKPRKLPDGTTRPQRIAFCVPAISLIDQTVQRFYEMGIRDVGVIQGDHPMWNPNAQVQVCSVQTLARRELAMQFDLVMIDEAHLRFRFYDSWLPVLREQGTLVIGLSATPWSAGLGKLFDDLIVASTIGELIEGGFLAPFRVYNAPEKPDLSGVKDVAGDYNEGQLSERMQKATLVADVVGTWKRLASDRRATLVFAVDRAHAMRLQAEYLQAGIPCGYVDQHIKRLERKLIVRRLESGTYRVVVNVSCLEVGFDLPIIDTLQICRPTKSIIRHVQSVGRGLRVAPGKVDCLILDHSTTHSRLGFVDDIYDEMAAKGLDDGTSKRSKGTKKKERERTERAIECIGCGALRKPMVRICPGCGMVFAPPSRVKVADGELVEAKRGKAKFTQAQKQAFWSALVWKSQYLSKTDGWRKGIYKARFGVWPRKMRDVAVKPTSEIETEIQRIQDDYRRSKQGKNRG
jgi:superfamily II DNA or RNA helicase